MICILLALLNNNTNTWSGSDILSNRNNNNGSIINKNTDNTNSNTHNERWDSGRAATARAARSNLGGSVVDAAAAWIVLGACCLPRRDALMSGRVRIA